MAVIGWASVFTFCFSVFSLGWAGANQNPTAAWALLTLAALSALTAAWAFGVIDRRLTPPIDPAPEDTTGWANATHLFDREGTP